MKRTILKLATLIIVCVTLVACNKPAPEPTANVAAATNSMAASPKSNPELEKLKGKWERPDGGYVLEVRSVDAEGKVDAGYFNPSPIHVARGLAYREAGATKLFIELRDVNYPGCTYKLEFDPKTDQLFGQYYQATMDQTYEITFARMK